MIQALPLLMAYFSRRGQGNEQANLSEKMLCPTKHFSGFNVFTREEKIT